MANGLQYSSAGADISKDGKYRYILWRSWGIAPYRMKEYACTFIMLNPSTADGVQDDPTIRRCVSFAKRLGCSQLEVVNLFAFRATKPKSLFALDWHDDPVGEQNKFYVERACGDAKYIICAWGTHGSYLGQDQTTMGWIGHRKLFCLGKTKDGFPKHPLYVCSDQPLKEFR